MLDALTIRMHRISTTDLKDALEHKALLIRQKLQRSRAAETLERNEVVKLQYRRMIERILTPPSSAKELADLQEYNVAAVWETLGCPAALAKTQGLVLQRQERTHTQRDLRTSTEELNAELKSIDADMAKMLLYTEIEPAEDYAGGVSVLEMRLKEASDRSTRVNAEEKLFDEALTDFGEIANVVKVLTHADVCGRMLTYADLC